MSRYSFAVKLVLVCFSAALLATSAGAVTFTVTNTSDSGAGSLRQAILDANSAPGADTITFSIGSGGAKLITPASLLPAITGPTTLDATTQPGYSGKPLIGLDGSLIIGALGVTGGISLQAANSVVSGFAITNFRVPNFNDGSEGAGVIVNAAGCVVKRSYLGVAIDGVTAGGNDTGIRLDNGSAGATIGLPGEGNVLSGGNTGISEWFSPGPNTAPHTIQNNYVGLDASGTTAIQNTYGVFIGAPALVKNNVIAGNRFGDGLFTSPNMTIRGNKFGVNVNGQQVGGSSVTAAVNIYPGFNSSVSNIVFGGLAAGEGNEVAGSEFGIYVNAASGVVIDGNDIHNSNAGISIQQATQSTITGNTIHNNFGVGIRISSGAGNIMSANSLYGNYQGISIGSVFPLPNDNGDLDGGANLGQNYPVLTSAQSSNGTTTVTGTLNSMALQPYHLEFFASASCTSFGYGEGKTFLGGLDVNTDGSGNTSFTFTGLANLASGSVITATASNGNNTSEFSACRAVTGPGTFIFPSSAAFVSEGGGSVVLTVSRIGGSIGAASVTYSTSSGTATAGSDFTTATGTLSFGDSETTKTFSVPILEDSSFEGPETFTVTLSNPTGGTSIGATPAVTVTIQDNDPSPTASINDVTVTEGNSGKTPAVFTITLSQAVNISIPLTWTTYTGSASVGTDLDFASGTVTFAPGETSKTLTVYINGDTQWESDETFFVTIFSSVVTIAKASGVGTIKNDDAGPTVSINDVTLTEGDNGTKNATFTVSMTPGWSGYYADISYFTRDGSAKAGSDYTFQSGYVEFNQNDTSKSITIPIVGDTQPENDEFFSVQISVASTCCLGIAPTLGKSTGTATILNDDAGVGPADQRFARGQTVSYVVQIGTPKLDPQTIALSASPAGIVQLPASITIPAGATGGTFDVKGLTLGVATITATLPDGIGGGTKHVTAQVLNDGGVVFDPPEASITVGSTLNVIVSITPAAATDVTVTLSASGPAVVGVPASVIIPAGQSTAIPVKGLATGTSAVFAVLPSSFASSGNTLAVFVLAKPTTPVLTSVIPSSGGTAGGTNVTLAGANLVTGCSVAIGGIPANTTFVDGSTLTAVTPAHVGGIVGVTLTCTTNTFTLPNAFTYLDAASTLTGVSPSFGSTAGGTLVRITGTNFHAGCWPFFDNMPGRFAHVVSATSITTSTPPHVAGSADVAVRCGPLSAALSGGFTYADSEEPAPVVTAVDPLAGAPGQSITISGVRFRIGDTVTFGTTLATVLSYAPDALVVRVPDLPLGKIAITVTDDHGHGSTTGPIFTVLEPSPPQITSLTPGSVAAGGEVGIDGKGFRPGYGIAFGGSIAPYVSLDYAHAVVRIPKTLAPGSYQAEVWNGNGQVVSLGPSLKVVDGWIVITGVTPHCGTTDGGVEVTITGHNFASGATVKLNDVIAANVRFVDAQTLTATVPPNAAGLARLVVTNPNGDSASLSEAFRYDSSMDPDAGCSVKRRAVH